MSTRGKKSTEKTKQNAEVRPAGVSSGNKKAEQSKPQKPADPKDKADELKQGPGDGTGSGKVSRAAETINTSTDTKHDGA